MLRAMRTSATILLVLSTLAACDDEPAAPADPVVAEQPEATPEEAEPEEEAPPANANEACAEVVVVAWSGAEYASDDITRDQAAARVKAEELRARIDGGEDFAAIARAESDASSTGPRGGLMGTYERDEWPAPHLAIRDGLFNLSVGQVSEVVEAPYGWVVMRRCPVEKVHTRHVLIRFEGARNAPEEITRTRDEALSLVGEVRGELIADGADFAAIAREKSEDGSAERGGDMGEVGRGRLAAAYEETAFGLEVDEISEPVETEFGFHVIQRLE
ncbi:MAG: hypothetical protein DRJ42_28745 [Deltaproteobacteria bacterium]|nr:MAG: hypothetical protein DRJ42_28745 [Deltaproteobacteria bacterium]